MSVPEELKIRIGEALKVLDISPEKEDLVAGTIGQLHEVLKTDVVPLAEKYEVEMEGPEGWWFRNRITKEIQAAIDSRVKLSSPAELNPELGAVCVLAWSTHLCPKGTNAEIEVGKVTRGLHQDSQGWDAITLDRVSLAKVIGDGSMLVEVGPVSLSRYKDVYATSPVIKLL